MSGVPICSVGAMLRDQDGLLFNGELTRLIEQELFHQSLGLHMLQMGGGGGGGGRIECHSGRASIIEGLRTRRGGGAQGRSSRKWNEKGAARVAKVGGRLVDDAYVVHVLAH